MTALVSLPIALPLIGAALALSLVTRPTASRRIAITASATTAVVAGLLLQQVAADGTLITDIGGWSTLGIVLVADRLSALVLVVSTLVVLATQLYAAATTTGSDAWPYQHVVHTVLGAGMNLALLTGDLFTLFVGFEVTLVASYVALVGPARREHVRTGMSYIVANVLVSTIFLLAIGAVYAVTGTLNLAELTAIWGDVPAPLRAGLGVLLLVTFATKAAAFPLFGWLPDAYRGAPPAVAAVFAGLLTKLGVYALVRTTSLLGLPEGAGWLLPLLAGATMLGGVVGALAQQDVRRILAFHITSQIGYMLLGVALVTEAGLAGAVFYLVHHILVKTALFMVAGMVEHRAGSGTLAHLGGMRVTTPILAVLFGIPALSLAGIPPFSGFVAKLALLQAGLDAGATVLVTVSLIASLLTVLSMAKIWSAVFWGDRREPAASSPAVRRARWAVPGAAATGLLVTASIAVTVVAGPLLALSQQAAADLLDTETYIEEVRGT